MFFTSSLFAFSQIYPVLTSILTYPSTLYFVFCEIIYNQLILLRIIDRNRFQRIKITYIYYSERQALW